MRHGRAALALGMAALFTVGVVIATLAFLWPSGTRTFDLAPLDFFAPGTVTSYNLLDGVPVISLDGRLQTNRGFHIVRLPDGEVRALSSKDPHLGCPVPWRPDFEFDGKTGFFRDPCHLETFGMAGDRVFGPAPRGLDRFAVTIENGRVVVDLNDVTLGSRTLAPPFSGASRPAATPQATAPAPDAGRTREVRGLFPTPRETEADVHRSIGPIPASQFSQWDGSSVVLYDLETGVERDLGEGSISAWPFSPDGTKLAWISGPLALRQGDAPAAANKVWVLDLTTMQRRSYGEGWQVTFHDDATLRITRDLGPLLSADFVDLFSGVPVSVDQSDLDVTRLITQYSHGYRVERLVRDGDFAHARQLVVLDDGSDALQFEAWLAVALGPNQLLVAVTVDEGAANLFLVDIEQGAATFLATMFGAAALPPRVGFAGLSANGGVPTHVAWSEYGCDPQQGRTRIYDLRTGTLTELDRALPVTIANGEDRTLGAAVHHVTTLDPETLDYGGVMPGDIGPIWADGQRWAVNGQSILELAAAERCNGVSG